MKKHIKYKPIDHFIESTKSHFCIETDGDSVGIFLDGQLFGENVVMEELENLRDLIDGALELMTEVEK